MPSKNTVTIIAPDGTPGDVPAENAQAALAAGGRIGVHVYAPDGTPGYIPHDQLGPALKAGATYAPESPQNQGPTGFIQSLLASSPAGVARGLANNFTQVPQNPEEAQIKGFQNGGVKGALGQLGLGTYRTLVQPSIDAGRSAVQDVRAGNYGAAGSEALQAIPIVGQGVAAGAGALRQAVNGDVPGAIGTTVGTLGTAGLAAALGGSAQKPVVNYTPEYAAARGVAKAVLPKEGDFNSYINTLQREKGNVDQFAKDQGFSTKTPINASMAMRESANNLSDFYNNQVLGPHSGEQVPVPMNFDRVGTQAPSGSRYATLQQVNDRVGQINDLLRSAQNNATAGQTMSDLAAQQDLVNERGALADILHNKLGQLTNTDPAAIAGIRQSIGARYDLADQTLAGANRTSLGAGRAERGISPIKGTTATQAVLDLINNMRGGPEAIANAKFAKAYPKLNTPATIGNPLSIEELQNSGISKYFK